MIDIIPAIDIIDGKCVRLTNGDFARKTVYSDSPVNIAKEFESAGIKRLHMVDLDGVRSGKVENISTLEAVASATDLQIDFGGGVSSDPDIASVFDAGAVAVNLGSAAVKDPINFEIWINKFGGERILLGADVRDRELAINGWLTDTGIDIVDFLIGKLEVGVTQAFVTDIGKDGALAGPSVELYREIIAAIPEFRLIASGGVTSLDDIETLNDIGCSGVIIGKAIYEGRIKLADLKRYLC